MKHKLAIEALKCGKESCERLSLNFLNQDAINLAKEYAQDAAKYEEAIKVLKEQG